MLSEHLKLSVVSAAYSDDPRQAATRASAGGFAGMQFEAISPSLDLTTLANTGRREFRHLIESKGLQLVGLRAGLGPKGFSIGADIDRLMSRLDSAMSAAAGLQL